MNVNELRIGNWVQCVTGGNFIESQITALFADGSMQTSADKENRTKEIHPIKITEDWILKLGFRKITDQDYSLNDRYFATHSKGGWSFALRNETFIFCDYIHELENLYFALTKEELVIS